MAARYWLGTLYDWTVPAELPTGCIWMRGQQERCPTTERLHHQLIVGFSKPQRLAAVKRLIFAGHWEPTKSSAADAYVHKEETRVEGTQFEFGEKALRRNNKEDWGKILELAKSGDIAAIPPDVQIRYYRTLLCIASDNERPIESVKKVNVFYGPTGTGKSRRAWEEAGLDAFPKDPRTKWFDGYRGEEIIIIDEFRGTIDISHILRWLDRYPCRVERKGNSCALRATTFYITSNLAPSQWYPDLDPQTMEALMRRLTNIVEFE